MTIYNQNAFRELIFSLDPDKIDEGMELLLSTDPQTIEDIFTEIGWEVMDIDAFKEKIVDEFDEDGETHHAYLALYLLGTMHNFGIEWVTGLDSIEFYDEMLTRLPKCIGDLTALTRIYSTSPLQSLPDTIGNLTNLTELTMECNELTCLPDSLADLTNLRTLSLGGVELTSLPDWIGDLTSLRELAIGGKALTKLPESIHNLTELTKLELFRSGLLDSIKNMDLSQLTNLNLYKSNLTMLPDWIGNLSHLQEINLEENPLNSSEKERIPSLLPHNCKILWPWHLKQ